MSEFNFKISDFNGPLDLLLTLVKENKMPIENLDILRIADQYLKFIYAQKKIEINIASDYLLIASTLILLKSKTILNSTVKLSTDEQAKINSERQKLINQLLLYKKYKDIIPKLENFYEQRKKLFIKQHDDVEKILNKKNQNEIYVVPNKMSFNSLHKAMQNAFNKWKISLFNNKKIIVQEVSAEQVEKDIAKVLTKYQKIKKISLTDFFTLINADLLTDQYLVVCFVCLLDLVKNGKINMFQENYNDEIFIKIL